MSCAVPQKSRGRTGEKTCSTTPRKRVNPRDVDIGPDSDEWANPSVTPSRSTASVRPSVTPSRSSRRKNKPKYKFDASDLWSSSSGEDDENVSSSQTDIIEPGAGSRFKRPPLKPVNGESSIGLPTNKPPAFSGNDKFNGKDNSATASSSGHRLEELSQALSSLSVSRSSPEGNAEVAKTRVDDSTESRSESEPSSFEFPLYGSPTRPGERYLRVSQFTRTLTHPRASI